MIYLLIFIFIVAVFVLLLVLNSLYKRTNAYRNQFIDIGKFVNTANQKDGSFDVVVLGSNAPKFAFDFSDVSGLACGNWAIGPETFEYDFIILKKFAGKLKCGATVIWPVCPGKFFLDKFKGKSEFVKYYDFLSPEEFPDYSRRQYITEYKYPLMFHPKRIIRLLKDAKLDTRLELDHNPMTNGEIEKDASWWIYGCWNPEFDIDIENMAPLSEINRQAVEYNIKILKEAIKFCQQNSLEIIFTYLPLTKDLSYYFSSDYVEKQMTRYVNKAIEGHHILLVDYMRDKRFQNPNYYINSFFMNRTGARKFTTTFVEENIRKSIRSTVINGGFTE